MAISDLKYLVSRGGLEKRGIDEEALAETAGLTPAQRRQAELNLQQGDPSVFKQHAEHLIGRLTGKYRRENPTSNEPPAIVQPGAPGTHAADFSSIVAQGKSPEQAQLDQAKEMEKGKTSADLSDIQARYDATIKAFPDMSDENKRLVWEGLNGIKTANVPWKNYVNEKGERQSFPAGQEPEGEGWQLAPTGGASRPVPYSAGAQSLSMAKQLHGSGQKYLDKDGQEWGLDTLPEGAVLIPVYEPGGKEYWSVGTDKGRYETAGNQRLFEPAVGAPNPNAPSIGPARVGTSSSSVTPGPAGQVVTSRTTTPGTTPAPGVGAAPPQPALQGPHGAAPAQHPAASRPQASQGKGPAPRESGGTPPIRDPKIPPMRGADEQRVASVAAPMAVVEQQVVGRGAKPLWSYSNVLNNPDMIKTVNLAMAAPLLQTPQGDKGITFWGTVATAMGLASAAQQATTETIVNARRRVQEQGGPEAVEFLDRLAELKGSIPNMKKVQGGSAAMGSLEPLYQESPIMNISSPEDFRNRTANMVRTMAAALEQTPGINKAHVDWLYDQADMAQGKEPAPRSSTKGSGPAQKANTGGGNSPIVQRSKKTGAYRYSMDGGSTWQSGQPPQR